MRSTIAFLTLPLSNTTSKTFTERLEVGRWCAEEIWLLPRDRLVSQVDGLMEPMEDTCRRFARAVNILGLSSAVMPRVQPVRDDESNDWDMPNAFAACRGGDPMLRLFVTKK